MIDFNTIPAGQRVPFAYVEFDNSQANGQLPAGNRVALIIGQMFATGSVAAATPVAVQNGAQAAQYFGGGSMLATMLDWFFSVNQTTPVFAIGVLDNPAGVAAEGKIVFTNAATAAGTIPLYIAGIAVPVAVNAGDTPQTVAANVLAAIAANASTALNPRNLVPVSAVVNGQNVGEVDLTALHKGLAGNDIDIRIGYYTGEMMPAGLTATITAMSGGTLNPDISPVIAAMGDVWYNDIAYPYNDAVNQPILEAELTSRFGGIRQIDGVAYNAFRGTAAATDTFGATRNNQCCTTMGTSRVPEPTYAWAAVNAAVASPALANDPARPLKTLVLTGLKGPAQADAFTWEERNLHLHSGISTYTVDASGNVMIERQVTNYQKNASNIADTSYLQVNTVATLGYLRYSTRSMITSKYPRFKLAQDGTPIGPGQAIVTPSIINGELVALASDWVQAGLIENLASFKAALTSQINAADNTRLDVLASPELVGQFEVFAEQIQFLL